MTAIYKTFTDSLLRPGEFWPGIVHRYFKTRETVRSYISPLALVGSLLIFVAYALSQSAVTGLLLAIINYLGSIGGLLLSYLLTKEYMLNRMNVNRSQVASLTFYSGAIYIVIHSVSVALGMFTLGQLFTLASLIFIRTLNVGLEALAEVPTAQRKNLLIIISISIICFQAIVSQILKFILGVQTM